VLKGWTDQDKTHEIVRSSVCADGREKNTPCGYDSSIYLDSMRKTPQNFITIQ
jgi:hypothetical protein